MFCPTLDEITTAVLSLLPRGRAWQTNDGLPRPGQEIAFNPKAFANNGAFPTTQESSSILWQYWRSFAVVMFYLTQRLCALRLEFWCQTADETRDEWMTEYGLPDDCEPFPDLCTKVAAIGGTRCEYYAAVAARMGWTIECVEQTVFCGSRAGKALAGKAKAGVLLGAATLKIIVHLNSSPAYTGPRIRSSRAGRMRAGQRLSCGALALIPLQCLLSRIIHAEILTIYEASAT
jgi:hypothetical protein